MFIPAIAVISILFLLLAFVVPEVLRIVLVSAGLLGLLGLRLVAADSRWAPRGAAWAGRGAS
jgi:hypothetical protein